MILMTMIQIQCQETVILITGRFYCTISVYVCVYFLCVCMLLLCVCLWVEEGGREGDSNIWKIWGHLKQRLPASKLDA